MPRLYYAVVIGPCLGGRNRDTAQGTHNVSVRSVNEPRAEEKRGDAEPSACASVDKRAVAALTGEEIVEERGLRRHRYFLSRGSVVEPVVHLRAEPAVD
jgi:hypothetical protein